MLLLGEVSEETSSIVNNLNYSFKHCYFSLLKLNKICRAGCDVYLIWILTNYEIANSSQFYTFTGSSILSFSKKNWSGGCMHCLLSSSRSSPRSRLKSSPWSSSRSELWTQNYSMSNSIIKQDTHPPPANFSHPTFDWSQAIQRQILKRKDLEWHYNQTGHPPQPTSKFFVKHQVKAKVKVKGANLKFMLKFKKYRTWSDTIITSHPTYLWLCHSISPGLPPTIKLLDALSLADLTQSYFSHPYQPLFSQPLSPPPSASFSAHFFQRPYPPYTMY